MIVIALWVGLGGYYLLYTGWTLFSDPGATADQIKAALFPYTYHPNPKDTAKFVKGLAGTGPVRGPGSLAPGGQAPGGHTTLSGLLGGSGH